MSSPFALNWVAGLLVTVDNGEQLYVSRQCAAVWKEKLREVERSFAG